MKTFHMIGNAHLDPVWLWDWREGYQENQATLLSALQRLEEFEDFVFTCSSAQFYEWIEESNPYLFERIQKFVDNGRWVIVGGWWVQPDCNIPGAEAFARHSLISQTYFKEKFGRTARTGYCVDSFGHNAMLPQILKLSGMDNYVFQRPSAKENPDLPGCLFAWQSPDGSRVNTFRLPIGYCIDKNIPERVEQFENEFVPQLPVGVDDIMFFYGVGNHGGGPTIANIKTIKELQSSKEDVAIAFSDPDTFFDKIASCELPVVEGDLQHHAAGCYAAESTIKAMNRRAENGLLAAEKWSLLAEKMGLRRSFEDLTPQWKQLLFNQFHDTLAGTGLERAYYDARNQLGEVGSVSDRVQTQALRALAFQINIPLDDTKLPVVVFNPHSWPVEAPVEVETGTFANIPVQGAIMVQDHVGRRVPCQKIDSSCKLNGRNRITFRAKVPALGYATYFLTAETVNDPFVAPLEDLVLENEYLRVEFDPATGGIASIFDRRTEQQILAAPTAATVIDDRDSDTWGHTLVRLDKREGNFTATQFKVMDHGPVRTCLKVRSSYGDSTLTQVYSLYAGEAQIHVDTTVNWQEKRRALKLEFPVNVADGQAAVEIPFGHLNKKMDGKEEPMQQWADISGVTPADDCACCGGRSIGLSVINDSKYSVDFHDNTIALTALRSPVYAHHDPYELREDEDYSYIDQGIQHFSYSLIPHGDWNKADTIKAAALLNQPLTTTFETFHGGALPQRGGFLAVDRDNIIMTALKKSYRGDDIILRMYESAGEDTFASIGVLTYTFKAHFKPYEIKTFRIRADKTVTEVNLLEEKFIS